jgi:hypothetical protein
MRNLLLRRYVPEGYPLAAEFITRRRNEAMHELKSFGMPRCLRLRNTSAGSD